MTSPSELLDTSPTRAIGYMCIAADTDPVEIAQLREGISAYAAGKGLHLLDVLIDTSGAGTSAFAELIEALREQDASVVIVPAITHLARFPGLQQALIGLLKDARALVMEIVPQVIPLQHDGGQL
ncbi:recombinase family protein [Streptosporangium sandarakinum]|uniref:recombinase family protein n=1 Tax=Streptosporangium sandarakinum TaxID=1260955 RepID=UPI0033A4D1F8